jgi:hypothetical protein
MTEQKEVDVYVMAYLEAAQDCSLGHFRFCDDKDEAVATLEHVRLKQSGHLILIQGKIIADTGRPSWMDE